ncbi:IS21 family transposase [Nocardia abscessus]|uniref:IS21 family transposase n=1 Tax=Nocardia TaxID=1817 RepID=UPI0018956A9A|nr:IS21 family transposase [Nocardia abscessus]MBF6341050.1 IS21 family transposase [Nocardia abscessus]
MLNVEDWAEIRRLHRSEGMAIRAIARRLKISKNTVKKALASHEPPRYQRRPRGSVVDEFEPAIRAVLAEFPDMPTTVIMERVGWQRGRTVFFERVQALRPLFKPVDPASRTEYQPGELAQCDLWFPPVDVPLGFGHIGRPPVLVMVTGYSRVMTAVMIPTRQSPDLLAGHWALISAWGRVPKMLVWDNEAAVGQWRGGKPQLTETMNAFRGSLGIKVLQCRPRDPEAKGLVERANGYLETSFLPGRSFAGPADFNAQLANWLVRANHRHHRRLGCRPVDRWDADRAAMLMLPPVDPVTGWRFTTRLPRDHYVRLDSNDYSVHPAAVGRRVEVRADLDEVVITCAGAELGRHRRCWADHQSITDAGHAAAAADLRNARRLVSVPAIDTEVEHRNLSDYDRMFDLDEASSSEEIA